MRLLRTLTLEPDRLGPETIRAVRAAGVSDKAIREAIIVGALFNIIDRVADAMGFQVRSPQQFARDAVALLRRGYRL